MSADLFSFSKRIALVTGGGTGLGQYIAKGLAEAGAARVYITGRRTDPLKLTAEAAPGIIIPILGDVSTIEGYKKIAEAFEQGERSAGVESSSIALDLLVNNAGIARNEGVWPEDASPERIRDALLQALDTDWAQEFATNVGSIQWLSACCLPYLVRAAKTNDGFREGRGCIVVNTSVSAFFHGSQGHIYAASKAAAHSITQSLTNKFTKLGVRVNSIAPANVPSEMNNPDDPNSFIARMKNFIPIGRIGNAEDTVAAVLYLASKAGSFVSGTVILVDGGIMAAR